MKKVKLIGVGLAILIGGLGGGLAGCSSPTPVAVTDTTTSVTMTPGRAAIMESFDGLVTVNIPSGTVNRPMVLRYRPLSVSQLPPLPEGFDVTRGNFELTISEVGQLVSGQLALNEPITITVNLGVAAIAAAQGLESNLLIQHYMDTEGWRKLSTTVDLAAFTARAEVDRPSVFALTLQAPADISPAGATATPTQTPQPSPAAVATTSPVPDIGLELRLMIMKRTPDDTVTVLEKGGVLTADDYYGLFFEPREDSWVYVLQQDSSGDIQVLFPNADYSSETNPLSGGTPVWIPHDFNNWFFLDDNIGLESFYVVASKEQHLELESLIAEDKREGILGPLAELLEAGERGLGGVKALEKEPKLLPDGKTPVLEEKLLKGDGDNFVYSLEFQHE